MTSVGSATSTRNYSAFLSQGEEKEEDKEIKEEKREEKEKKKRRSKEKKGHKKRESLNQKMKDIVYRTIINFEEY